MVTFVLQLYNNSVKMGTALKSLKSNNNDNNVVVTDSYVITKTGKKIEYNILTPEQWEATRIKAYKLVM